jgi:aminobenzoyl-glutamate transport protein
MSTDTRTSQSIFLDFIEKVGNRLPDPITLFALGALLIMVLSHIAATRGWEVIPVEAVVSTDLKSDKSGQANIRWVKQPDKKKTATSLLTQNGLFWALSSSVDNFANFKPMRVVLVGMLGIGVAELTGLLPAALKLFLLVVPGRLLTPAVVFIGIMSSMTLDAGYVVLPPLAAALYKAAGRSPLAGIAASFAGVSAGFNANLFVTGLDPLLAALSATGAQIIDPEYRVAATCNLWFMIASTITMTLTGWLTTAWFIERRMKNKAEEEGGPAEIGEAELDQQRLSHDEKRGLVWAAAMAILLTSVVVYSTRTPGTPLYGKTPESWSSDALKAAAQARESKKQASAQQTNQITEPQQKEPEKGFARWVTAIVPLIFIAFILPGIVYGIRTRKIKNDKTVSKLMSEAMATMAPIIVLSFFAAQFIEYFRYSGLDIMLAQFGGQALAQAELSPVILIVAFIFVTALFNLFVGSMSAKYTMFAPVFIPMLMMVGISPELTQASYRIGDSITNIITPLNAYLIIVLAILQKYVPKAGMGTLISAMMPYTFTFGFVWIVQLVIWYLAGWPLGENGPLHYPPGG